MGKSTGLLMVAALMAALVAVPVPGIAAAATTASHGAVNHAASLPRPADVIRGRFVTPAALDGGVFEVAPAPADDRPLVSRERAAQEIWASPVLQGDEQGPLGYGLVTISLRVSGVPHVTRLPGWVGFARSSENAHCPQESPSPTSNPGGLPGQALPSSGYAAVVIGATHGSPAVTYSARSVLCESVQPAALALATEVISVPWQALTSVENASIRVRTSMPACGELQGIDSGGSAKVVTITVAAVVPDVHGRCDGPHEITQTVALGPADNPGAPPPLASASTAIRHGHLGPMLLAVAPGS
jgi:hypothetical protein